MFPSDALLQLVFANDTDIYFCNGFMQADLNQYLWLKLPEKFKTVRFMYVKRRAVLLSYIRQKPCAGIEL